jgi:hypothetical protein
MVIGQGKETTVEHPMDTSRKGYTVPYRIWTMMVIPHRPNVGSFDFGPSSTIDEA